MSGKDYATTHERYSRQHTIPLREARKDVWDLTFGTGHSKATLLSFILVSPCCRSMAALAARRAARAAGLRGGHAPAAAQLPAARPCAGCDAALDTLRQQQRLSTASERRLLCCRTDRWMPCRRACHSRKLARCSGSRSGRGVEHCHAYACHVVMGTPRTSIGAVLLYDRSGQTQVHGVFVWVIRSFQGASSTPLREKLSSAAS
jgi:hypothetical protein